MGAHYRFWRSSVSVSFFFEKKVSVSLIIWRDILVSGIFSNHLNACAESAWVQGAPTPYPHELHWSPHKPHYEFEEEERWKKRREEEQEESLL